MVLNGLLFVTLKTQNAPQPLPASTKKQEKKQQQLKTAQASTSSMAWSTVSPGLLERLEMTEDFDLLVRLLFFYNAHDCMQQQRQHEIGAQQPGIVSRYLAEQGSTPSSSAHVVTHCRCAASWGHSSLDQQCAHVQPSVMCKRVIAHVASTVLVVPLVLRNDVASRVLCLQLLGCLVFALNAVFAVASKWLLYPIVAPFYLSLTLAGFGFVGSLMHKVRELAAEQPGIGGIDAFWLDGQ
jgi:hypothetical protein